MSLNAIEHRAIRASLANIGETDEPIEVARNARTANSVSGCNERTHRPDPFIHGLVDVLHTGLAWIATYHKIAQFGCCHLNRYHVTNRLLH